MQPDPYNRKTLHDLQTRIDAREKRNRQALADVLNVPAADAETLSNVVPANALGLARFHALDHVQTLHDISTDGEQPASARVAAATAGLRAAGIPANDAAVNVQVNNVAPGPLSSAQLDILRDMLAHPERYVAALGLAVETTAVESRVREGKSDDAPA